MTTRKYEILRTRGQEEDNYVDPFKEHLTCVISSLIEDLNEMITVIEDLFLVGRDK